MNRDRPTLNGPHPSFLTISRERQAEAMRRKLLDRLVKRADQTPDARWKAYRLAALYGMNWRKISSQIAKRVCVVGEKKPRILGMGDLLMYDGQPYVVTGTDPDADAVYIASGPHLISVRLYRVGGRWVQLKDVKL